MDEVDVRVPSVVQGLKSGNEVEDLLLGPLVGRNNQNCPHVSPLSLLASLLV